MKALKSLVIAMGALIIVGIALVGYGLLRGKRQALPAEKASTDVKGGYFASEVPMPRGATLGQVTATGDRVVLRFSGPDGDKLVLLDAHTGQLAGTVTLIPDKN